MDIIDGIKRYIAHQKEQGIKVHAMAFAMYPHQYKLLCSQLILKRLGICISEGAFSVDGVNIGFYQANQQVHERTKSLEHDTIFNNIIYNP